MESRCGGGASCVLTDRDVVLLVPGIPAISHIEFPGIKVSSEGRGVLTTSKVRHLSGSLGDLLRTASRHRRSQSSPSTSAAKFIIFDTEFLVFNT